MERRGIEPLIAACKATVFPISTSAPGNIKIVTDRPTNFNESCLPVGAFPRTGKLRIELNVIPLEHSDAQFSFKDDNRRRD